MRHLRFLLLGLLAALVLTGRPGVNDSAQADHGPGTPSVVFGFDMETDIGSFTPFYEGVEHGTPRILKLLQKHDIRATFFWTGHAAENNPEMVRRVRDAGYETGCHSLYHETVGDPIFPLPNWSDTRIRKIIWRVFFEETRFQRS